MFLVVQASACDFSDNHRLKPVPLMPRRRRSGVADTEEEVAEMSLDELNEEIRRCLQGFERAPAARRAAKHSSSAWCGWKRCGREYTGLQPRAACGVQGSGLSPRSAVALWVTSHWHRNPVPLLFP